MGRFIQWITGKVPEFVPIPKPDLPSKPVIKNVLRSNDPQGLEVTDSDPIEDMRRQLEDLHINQTKMKKAIKKNSSKPKSSCRKTKSKSKSKTQKKKSSGRSKCVNAHIISDESFSDSSDSENSMSSSENELETNTLSYSQSKSGSSESSENESSSSESDESETRGYASSNKYEVNTTKKKITYSDTKSSKKRKSARPRSKRSLLCNKTFSKKSSNTFSDKKSSKNIRLLKIPTNNISLNAFFVILRSIVDSFTRTQPKEVTINGYNMINAKFIALKDPVLNHFTSNFSDKECEKFWHEITMWGKLLSYLKRPYKTIGAEVDKNKKPSVKWHNNSLKSSGISYNISVMVGQGENSCTISEDFPVMDDDKPWLLLGTPWLDRAGWEPIVKREFKLIHKGKVITIPLSVHKSQREIFKPEINLTFHKQDSVQVSTDSSRPEGKSEIQHSVPSLLRRSKGVTLKGYSPSSKDNNVLLEEWHAPAGFSPDFSLSSEDDFLQSKSLDNESEIQDFTSSLNHCEAGHFVSDLGLDSKSQCSAIKKK
ncbi:hypothetical protein F8M41_023535 [Gigaspora margarita]|uniref:Uncharacterized protein n=1 Tax=Gigaspora margarita TaxID=4874 RepID=A0A8H4AD72_GIGMA|nr:hypothetical protein F8M41_023535 [Gigaspora margarita]